MAKKAAAVAAPKAPLNTVQLDLKVQHITFRIVGKTPMIQHQWDEKAKEMMRRKHAGIKTKDRSVRDPQAEGEAATYRTPDGKLGFPLIHLKTSIIAAAHRDLGIDRTRVRRSVFILPDKNTGSMVLPLECKEEDCKIQEDPVRVGPGSTDLRYRPYFYDWAVVVTAEIDATMMDVKTLFVLVDRAGFGIGVGERRPEKGGEFGRFMVDPTFEAITQDVAYNG